MTEPSAWLQPRLARLLGVSRERLTELLVGGSTSDGGPSLSVSAKPATALVLRLTSDGRVVFAPCAQAEGDATVDIKPASFFAAVLRTLIDNDNLFGPREVVARAEQRVATIGHAWASPHGADRVELVHLRAQFAEFCAWLYQGLGNHRAAQQWTDRALEWSHVSGDQQLTVYVLARKRQLAGDMEEPDTATSIGHAAVIAAPHVKLAAIASTYTAHGHAIGGNRESTDRAYDTARELVAQSDNACGWGAWLDSGRIATELSRLSGELKHVKTVSVEQFQDIMAATVTAGGR